MGNLKPDPLKNENPTFLFYTMLAKRKYTFFRFSNYAFISAVTFSAEAKMNFPHTDYVIYQGFCEFYARSTVIYRNSILFWRIFSTLKWGLFFDSVEIFDRFSTMVNTPLGGERKSVIC